MPALMESGFCTMGQIIFLEMVKMIFSLEDIKFGLESQKS